MDLLPVDQGLGRGHESESGDESAEGERKGGPGGQKGERGAQRGLARRKDPSKCRCTQCFRGPKSYEKALEAVAVKRWPPLPPRLQPWLDAENLAF